MANKQLNIKVNVSEAERMLQRLHREGVRLLVVANKEMLKLRGTTQDTAKVMEYTYGRQIERQTKNLDLYTRKVERLNKIFKAYQYNYDFQSSVGNTAMAERAKAGMDKVSDRIVVAEAARQAYKDALDNLKDIPKTIIADRVNQAALIAQVVGSVMQRAGGMAQTLKTAETGNLASIMGFAGGEIQRFMSGDVASLGMIMNKKTKLKAKMNWDNIEMGKAGPQIKDDVSSEELLNLVMNGDASSMAKTSRAASGLELLRDDASGVRAHLLMSGGQALVETAKAAQGFVTGVNSSRGGGGNMSSVGEGYYAQQLGNASGGALSLFGAGMDIRYGGAQAAEAKSFESSVAHQRAMRPYEMMMLQNLQETAPIRLQASRRLGNQHLRLAGEGAGYGLDIGSSLSLGMGLAEQFGGAGGLAAARAGMRAETMGFDRGAAGQLIGQLNAAGGGKGGEEALARIIGKGTKAGLEQVNIQFFEKFAQATAASAFGRGGANGGLGGFAQSMMFGINKNSTMADIQGNISGANALSGLLSGGTPRMMAMGLENAKRVLGNDASGFKTQALASSSIADLMASSNEKLDALGISPEERQRFLSAQMGGLALDVINDNSEEGRYLLAGAKSAGGLKDFLRKDKKGQGMFATMLQETFTDKFGNYKDALGAVGQFAAIGEEGVAGGSLKKIADGNALGQLATQASGKMMMISDEQKEDLIGDMKRTFEAIKAMKEIQPGVDAAEKAVEVLNKVFGVLQKFETLDADKIVKNIQPKPLLTPSGPVKAGLGGYPGGLRTGESKL